MERKLLDTIQHDLENKIVILTGPRQSGKTTLSKSVIRDFEYLNYDLSEHREALRDKSWDRNGDLIVFDELHKMNSWKSWLKGVYDVEGIPPRLLVTGSAKLDTYRKMGDSLAGRFFRHRLHPFTIKEVGKTFGVAETANALMEVGGFPEPFLKGAKSFYRRWQKSHLDIILRQDLLDLETVRDIRSMEILIDLLKKRVGSTVSYASLARDLQKDAKTIKRWLTILENLYVIFQVPPFHRNIARSILKEPKYYFWDNGLVQRDKGARLENLVACALRSELDVLEDVEGLKTSLHFLRTKEGKEIDFYVDIEDRVPHMIEVKYSEDHLSKNFKHFAKFFSKPIKATQLVFELKREKTFPKEGPLNGIEIRRVAKWLSQMPLGIRINQKEK